MSFSIHSKTIALCFGVLAMIFVFNYLVLAWTEPSAGPPNNNVAAPLNVGNTGQSKSGGLILNTGGAVTGLVVDKGNVGIGITSPNQKLDVSGQIHASEDICTDAGGGKCLSTVGSGSGGGSGILSCSLKTCSFSGTAGCTATCPAGTIVTGGGADTGGSGTVWKEYPSGNGWYGNSNVAGTAYAICCNQSGGSGGTSYTYYCYNNRNWGTPVCADAGGTQGYCPSGYTQKLALGSWGVCIAVPGSAFLGVNDYFLPPGGNTCGSGANYNTRLIGDAYICSQ
jgi:hypothetical protein